MLVGVVICCVPDRGLSQTGRNQHENPIHSGLRGYTWVKIYHLTIEGGWTVRRDGRKVDCALLHGVVDGVDPGSAYLNLLLTTFPNSSCMQKADLMNWLTFYL